MSGAVTGAEPEWTDLTALVQGAAAFGIHLSAEQRGRFTAYQRLLQEWNRRLNLTAIDQPHEIQIQHFLDSVTCALITGDLSGQRLIDVGSGAGFPGLPLKILYPDLRLTLAESVVKKTRFLEELVTALGLDQVTILAERAERLGRQPGHREGYDWATARAVASMPVLAEYLLPLVRPGGHMLAQKGAGAAEEVAAASQGITLLGGGPAQLHPVQLPGREETRYLIVVEKLAPTPERYPRRPGMPAKRPLA